MKANGEGFMKLIKCSRSHIHAVTEVYHRTIRHLEENINYPRWSPEHPSDQSIAEAVESGVQYLCIKDGEPLGAVVLSEAPEGYYQAGEWSRELTEGEYLVIHALAVHPSFEHKGVGTFMVEQCVALARQCGYRAVRLDVVPGNLPAERLYKKLGFTYAGTKDLRRNIDGIPAFDLFERNIE